MTKYDRLQNCAHRLNYDAHKQQMKGRSKRLRQFTPCAKSLRIIECMNEDGHIGVALMEAAQIPCSCHSGLTEEQLVDMSFDDAAKRCHYGI